MTWTKDRNPITENDRIQITMESVGVNQTTSKLSVKDLVGEDSGSYQASIRNPLGQISTQSKISVVSTPIFVKELCLSTCSTPTSEGKTDDYNVLFVNEKSQVRIECQVNGQPKPTVKWFKNDVEIQSNEKFKIETKFDIFLLTIKDCSTSDRDLYRVEAQNNAGTSVSKLFIDINSLPVIVKGLTGAEVTVTESNQSHEYETIYKSGSKGDAIWFLADKPIKKDDPHYSFVDEAGTEPDTYSSKLIIKDLTSADAGNYKCRVKNGAGEIATSGHLAILKAQLFVEKFAPLNEFKNDIRLTCKLDDSNPKSAVTWFKDNAALTASKRILISASPDQEKKYTILSLIVQDTTSADTGVYKVKAVSKITTIEAVSQVNVLVAPKITRDLKPTLQCAAGEPVKLEVAAIGSPEPEFSWFHVDHENKEVQVVSNEDINATKNGLTYLLQIAKASSMSKGKYILRLKNNAGSVEASCTLLIDG